MHDPFPTEQTQEPYLVQPGPGQSLTIPIALDPDTGDVCFDVESFVITVRDPDRPL